MPLVYVDRVQETTPTTGTGTLTLAGASLGYRSFSAVGVGNETYYVILDTVTNAWEVGIGTYSIGALSRDTVLASSNANALVNFGPGSKTVFATAAAQFFADALSTVGHATINHTGLPGVPLPEAFTAGVHSTTDHLGITGVGNLATAPGPGLVDHATVNHSGLPGVPAAETFTAGVHATTDHTGITGVGLTTKQSLVLPASMTHQLWTNNPITTTFNESMVPNTANTPLGDRAQFSLLTIDDIAMTTPTHLPVRATGFDHVAQYTAPGVNTRLRIESDSASLQGLLPRLVFKFRVTATGSIPNRLELGIGNTATGSFVSNSDAIWASMVNGGTWTIERRVANVSQPPTATGIAATTALYVLFNYTSVSSGTVAFYDAVTLAVLFTTTFAAPSPNAFGMDKVRLYYESNGGLVLQLASILLSFNG